MDRLRVRAYDVKFGDAILVSVPDRDPATEQTETRHILIDVGNVLTGAGGADEVFQPVIDDVLDILDGRPLDLYVMTHEHLDHIQGLLHASSKLFDEGEFEQRFAVAFSWLTASAAEDYYDTHPDARKKRLQLLEAYDAIERYLRASPDSVSEPFRGLLLNNNPRSTADCVAYLRGLADTTTYVHRESDLEGTHPFKEARLRILAPEEDTSDYYGRFVPMALGLGAEGPTAAVPAPDGDGRPAGPGRPARPLPPPGVDAAAFYALVESRRRGLADNLLAIDRAANNSSIVFELEWRGWTLLFPGDAEIRSWKTMDREGVLAPVHFLKVSHHGSHNGTPDEEILEKILPASPPDARPRSAVVSTAAETYNGIPHEPTNEKLRARCDLLTTLQDPPVPFVDLEFPDPNG